MNTYFEVALGPRSIQKICPLFEKKRIWEYSIDIGQSISWKLEFHCQLPIISKTESQFEYCFCFNALYDGVLHLLSSFLCHSIILRQPID